MSARLQGAVGRLFDPLKTRVRQLVKPLTCWATSKLNGKRGAVLATFAFLFLMVALSYLRRPDDPLRTKTFAWLPDWFPFYTLGGIWAVVAVVAAVNAFRYKSRPARSDAKGFQALSGLLIGWAGMYLMLWFTGYAPSGWYSAAIFGTFAIIVLICASWTNETKHKIDIPELSALIGKSAETETET